MATLVRKDLGRREYLPTWKAMQAFADQQHAERPDQLWLLEHPPVFTLGRNGKPEHVLDPGDIPLVHIDRGGQVTYHGPGQLVVYTLVNLRRKKLGIRQMVTALENAIIALLADYGVKSNSRPDAPGVYVDGKKIAALGLRVRNGYSYHGLSLNLDMDLRPFQRINPCGYEGLQVTQLTELIDQTDFEDIKTRLSQHLAAQLGYDEIKHEQ